MAEFRFQIAYRTQWGECLRVNYRTTTGERGMVSLTSTDGDSWGGTLALPADTGIIYTYEVVNDGGELLRGEGEGCCRQLNPGHRAHILLADVWGERELPPVFGRSAFRECIYRPARLVQPEGLYRLRMQATPPPDGCRWGISGSSASLGMWQPEAVRPLSRTDVYEWSLSLSLSDFENGVEYKYVLLDEKTSSVLAWEDGGNRRIAPQVVGTNETVLRTDDAPRIDVPAWRGAGVVIPVFSLRSKGSFGVGDFGDLKSFITWAASTGMKAVQLLPINDTTSSGTWRDSYPYSGISVFALHPLYLDMREWANSEAYAGREGRREELNALPEMDYEAVFAEKMMFLYDLYEEHGDKVLKTKGCKDFCAENAHWLMPYSRFCERVATGLSWVRTERTRQVDARFFLFVQYLLHRQMQAAHEHARSLGVILKGDIPIGIGRNSVPAEAEPKLFHFDGQAGAPPDAFARQGQNWGFPTYNWEEMRKDGYGWWRRRFRHMANYFDAYRIDHVLGFFRIWEIPSEHVHGVLGMFRPALPFSRQEIENYGFNTATMADLCRPVLTEQRLEELAEEVGGHGLLRFFVRRADGCFVLKEQYDTQRKLMEAVPESSLRNVLLGVIAEVLFIEDKDCPDHYHPRIAAQETWRFSRIDEKQRQAFNRLYDDFFYVRHNRFWAEKAMEKLPIVVGEAPLLPCAEDLGMVPPGVPEVLRKLNILTLEIQRMPKRFGVCFDDLRQNPWLSVSTIATHDMPPLRLWWKEERRMVQIFWNEVLGRSGEAPEEASSEVCEQIVARHLDSPSMLCLLALQDLLAMDETLRHPKPAEEQINNPANPDQYWRYRMHLNIEDLTAATAFNEKVRGLISRSGR